MEEVFADDFHKYFEIVRADTPDMRKQAYRLRYQVYCVENRIPGFEASDYPEQEESDEHDVHSLHLLLLHRPSQAVAGTLRLVMHDSSEPMWLFPIEQHAGLLSQRCEPAPRREAIAEISRFILSARFRCRRGESIFPDGLAEAQPAVLENPAERRHGFHPVLGLIKGLMELSWDCGISFWYAGMEPRLQRRLERFGVGLHLAAEAVSYHGTVNAYFSSVPEVLAQCRNQCPEVWRFLTENGKIWPISSGRLPPPSRQSSPFSVQTAGMDEMKKPTPTRN